MGAANDPSVGSQSESGAIGLCQNARRFSNRVHDGSGRLQTFFEILAQCSQEIDRSGWLDRSRRRGGQKRSETFLPIA
jgi:hypothetical protein